MTLQLKQSGNYTYLYAIKSYRKEDGKCTTKVVHRFGTVEELREKLNGKDPIEWAKAKVAEMTATEKEENKRVIIDCNPMALITKGEQRCYNGGYLFLQKIYYELGLDYICKKIAKKHKMVKYDLNGILSMLVYTQSVRRWRMRRSSSSSRIARWSRCTGRFLCWRRSSTRSRPMCTSAASNWGSATPAWCTTT